jgi:hypothetical protein
MTGRFDLTGGAPTLPRYLLPGPVSWRAACGETPFHLAYTASLNYCQDDG